MTIQLGSPCAGINSKGQTVIGAVVQINDGITTAYKIEWCDGYSQWYNYIQASAYAEKARRSIR